VRQQVDDGPNSAGVLGPRDGWQVKQGDAFSWGLDVVSLACKSIGEVTAVQRDLVTVLPKFKPRLTKVAPGGERPEV